MNYSSLGKYTYLVWMSTSNYGMFNVDMDDE